MSGTVSAPTVRRWMNLLHELGLTRTLNPEDALVAAIQEGRDADAVSDCRRRADTAQADLESFEAQYPELARARNRLLHHGSYHEWIEWVANPSEEPQPRGKPPASLTELKNLGWFEDEIHGRELLVHAWGRAASRGNEFNLIPDEAPDDS